MASGHFSRSSPSFGGLEPSNEKAAYIAIEKADAREEKLA